MPHRAPVIDSHVHLYEVTRPGGVPWPPAGSGALDENRLLPDYEALARPLGVVGTVVVEASPLVEDTRWVLEHVGENPLFVGLVAALDVTAPDVEHRLAALAAEPRVVGVRAFLWTGSIQMSEAELALFGELARNDMTLDLVSRKGRNPAERVVRLAEAAPGLRVVVDHLAGARGKEPNEHWRNEVKRLSSCPNVHLKLSALYDMFNAGPDENTPWASPATVNAYRTHLDAALEAFGDARLIFGSNWPVTEMSGSLADELRLIEEYLAPLGTTARNRVMHDNARAFYRRFAAPRS